MSLETVPPEIHNQIFSYLTDIHARPHPFHHPNRPPAFPAVNPKDEVASHAYLTVALVSRALNFAIESFAQHMLAIIRPADIPPAESSKPASTLFSYRRRLLKAATKARCIICLTDVNVVVNGEIREWKFNACKRCLYRFFTTCINELGAEYDYFVPMERLIPNCIPVVHLRYPSGKCGAVFERADVQALASSIYLSDELVGDRVLASKLPMVIESYNDKIPFHISISANRFPEVRKTRDHQDDKKLLVVYREHLRWLYRLDERCVLAFPDYVTQRRSNDL